eukprot:scaffold30427_cov54-Phaeocystis_antarctica.AAC.1
MPARASLRLPSSASFALWSLFLPAAAAAAAAGFRVPVVQRSQFLYALIFFVRPDSSISDDRRQPGPQPPPWMVGSCLGVLSLVPATGAESRPDLRFPGSRVLAST